MKTRLRIGLLACGAAALMALANVRERSVEDAAPVGPVAAPAATQPRGEREDTLDYGTAFRRQPLPEAGPAFQARSWAPPPPPPSRAPPAQPPIPVAPAIPYAFLGRMESDAAPKVFLRRSADAAVVVAAEHDTLDGAWRLEAIGGQGLVMTYLPLNEQKILPYK